MTLEDLVEAHLEGKEVDVPEELRADFGRAVAGYDALQYALGETIAVAEAGPSDRPPPAFPEDYELVRELGRGGMGVVYLVRQKSLGRMVAVKVLRPGEAAFGRLVERFLGEARHLARLRHPNIVSIHEIGRADDEPYFTMDYVEGEPLSAVLERERLSPSRALAILKQAAEGVRHAHAQGIIHRDLKPGNILLDAQGRAYVTDFGLARDMTATSKLTHSGEVMGTPAYMAPEQAQGQSELIGEATDVHALGVILYEMLTGRPPYGSDAPANVLVRLLKEEPVPPRALDRRISRDLETICLKALAKSPEGRYPTVQAFLEDLRRFESGTPVLARRPGWLARAGRFARKHAKVAAAVLLPILLLLAVAPWIFDKTTDQLVAVADEQRGAGEYQAAIRVYRRALAKAGGEQRRAILGKMLDCCEEIQDEKSALDACLLVAESDPNISFGKYDYLVAQAVVAQARSKDANQSLRDPTDKSRPLFDLARRRLQVFLDGNTGSPEQRKEAGETFAVIDKVLRKEPFVYPSHPQSPDLPDGTAEELLKQARDPKSGPWERGKAAYVAGKKLEAGADKAAALAAYRQAFDLMRPIYPTYDGMSRGPNAPPASECVLLRQVFSAVQRLDPATPDLLRGRLRLQFEGVELPADVQADVQIGLRVVLHDPAVKDANWNLCRRVSLPVTRSVTLGVADGRYRLSISKESNGWTTEAGHRFGALLQVDDPSPSIVEMRGGLKELTVGMRLLQEIKVAEPADGATFDLQRNLLRWTAVAGAASYRIQLGYKEDTLQRSTLYGGGAITVSSPSVCLGALPASQTQGWIRTALTPGRTGIWQVEAFDRNGRKVGAMVETNHSFLVARGLESR